MPMSFILASANSLRLPCSTPELTNGMGMSLIGGTKTGSGERRVRTENDARRVDCLFLTQSVSAAVRNCKCRTGETSCWSDASQALSYTGSSHQTKLRKQRTALKAHIRPIHHLTSAHGTLASTAAPVQGFGPPGPPGRWACSSCTGPSSTVRTDPCRGSPASGTASNRPA